MTRTEFARRIGATPTGPGSDAPMVVCERDSVAFRRQFTAAAAGSGPVFLANPDWGMEERREFDRLVHLMSADWDAERGWLMIPTGGTTGGVKLARHDHLTIEAAVAGFTAHFGLSRINAVGVLPLHHVGGLMGWLRTTLTGGEFSEEDWKRGAAAQGGRARGKDWVISVVPTQLSQLLASETGRDWLRGIGVVLLGGGAVSEGAADEARRVGIRCALGYGMTETMAMVTALKPEEFLAGRHDSGASLSHAQVDVGAEDRIQVAGPSVFRGYWPEGREAGAWLTADRGEWGKDGGLRVLGRMDDLINSGGEKVDASEVERVLFELVPGVNFAVVGVPDPKWGQRVVAGYSGIEIPLDVAKVEAVLADRLAKFKWPKTYVRIDPWPVNRMGKLNRSELKRQLERQLQRQRQR